METTAEVATLRARVADWRRDGHRIGFVPTMGNLHAGHFSLVDIARGRCDRVVASVFVNPAQFGPQEDFSTYPRTLDADRDGLAAHRCDVLFAPQVEAMYPSGVENCVRVEVPGLGEILDGASRPGHFTGVATVVTRLFNLVQPDLAVFGQKDYQQLLVIRRLVADLQLPIEIVGAPIVREANGLAMSSRNQYLSRDERDRATVIHRTLQQMRTALAAGDPLVRIESMAMDALRAAGSQPDYAVLRDASDLSAPAASQRANLVALVAARFGRARLIDNLSMD